jgi:hypothetical protein
VFDDDGMGWVGADILQTNIRTGDVVHMFYDFPGDLNPNSGIFAANYVRGIFVDSDTESLTVQLQGHSTFVYPVAPYTMYVDNYKNVQADVQAYLYDSTGELVGRVLSDVNGRVKFSGSFNPGTYIVTTDSIYYPEYSIIDDDTYFALTGAYSEIVIPYKNKQTCIKGS